MGIFTTRLKNGDPLHTIRGDDLQKIDDILSDLEVYNGVIQRNGSKWVIVPSVQDANISNNAVKESIEIDNDFKAHFVGDSDSPTALKYYGTDTNSAKGYHGFGDALTGSIGDSGNLADSTGAGTVPTTSGKTHRMVLQLNASLEPTWQFLEADS